MAIINKNMQLGAQKARNSLCFVFASCPRAALVLALVSALVLADAILIVLWSVAAVLPSLFLLCFIVSCQICQLVISSTRWDFGPTSF